MSCKKRYKNYNRSWKHPSVFCLIFSLLFWCTGFANNSVKEELTFYEQGFIPHGKILDTSNYYHLKTYKIDSLGECGYYVNKSTGEKFVFYLEYKKTNKGTVQMIRDEIKIRTLQSDEYLNLGSFKKRRGTAIAVAIENYDEQRLFNNSVEIYELWIYHKNRRTFIKKVGRNFCRIRDGFYRLNDLEEE